MKKQHNISQEEFEQIETYLNQPLKGDALASFENRLQNEDDFRAKVEDIKSTITGIEIQALKSQLNEFHDTMDLINHTSEIANENKSRLLNWKYLAIAATLVIALSGFWFFSSNSNDRLYANYFTPDPGLPTTMSSNSNYEFYNTMVTYKRGKYSKAIEEWQFQLLKHPESDTLNYFIGVAKMADKNEVDAIAYLKKVSELQANTFKNDAYFYLGLAYIKVAERKQAIEALKKSTHPESEALIQKLN
ncbi:tetratricopeptide repeat protein [Paucihalobacter sp.]|uniref:tetratricopeptide repeat protein n=1 Tax=Paucihalobacter sp. TaxID=2850405 RepID=UPI002FE05F23